MAEAKTVKFKLNGQEVEAKEGELVIDAAAAAGVHIPRYCYHPALGTPENPKGNPGNCRLCVVEVQGAPKPMVSCRTQVREGLVVDSDSPAAKRAQASSLELHLVNHPLDCPVCDQSGECGLQNYYMQIGRYESSVREDKLHKDKRITAGPHVMLDQERCILCTRCTRFVDNVTKTHELGIFGRGHKERIELVPGKTLDNAYSGNVVDLCPVGALTERDFRYKVRVWYLDETDSVCPGCSRGCSISVHTNTKRPWHNEGRRVARIKPRHNPEVNGWWICDEGRFGYGPLDKDRLGRVMRLKDQRRELSWTEAFEEIAEKLAAAKGLAVAASGMLSNEDWAAMKDLFAGRLAVKDFAFTPEPDQVGEEDQLLRRREKVPNLKGGEAQGFTQSQSWETLAKDIDSGKVRALYVVERDPAKIWGAKGPALLSKLDLLIYQGPNKNATSELAHYRLPATAYVEEEGHFTNFEGKVQNYKQALAPLGAAKPDWAIFRGLAKHLEGSLKKESVA